MIIKNKVIIIFGFSGSGKSTLANLIAKKYNLRVIHPSGILRNLYEQKEIDLSKTKHNKGFWETKKGIKLFKNRLKEKEPLDIISDKILLEEVKKGNVVIDSWNLPWLTNKGIKIYLKANLNERAKRVAKRSNINYFKAVKIIKLKDEETRKLFRREYCFDIKNDLNVFDLIVNTTSVNQDEVFNVVCEFLIKKFRNK